MIAGSARERTRFLRFAVVGAIGSVVDFGVMNLLTRFAQMDLVPAGTISFAMAVLSNFLGNRHWTYPDSRSRPIIHQLGMFAAVNFAGIAIRTPILHFLEPPMLAALSKATSLTSRSAELLAKNLTLAVAIAIVMLWNFFANRYWTYGDVEAG
jgi:putative flippase GtrA